MNLNAIEFTPDKADSMKAAVEDLSACGIYIQNASIDRYFDEADTSEMTSPSAKQIDASRMELDPSDSLD